MPERIQEYPTFRCRIMIPEEAMSLQSTEQIMFPVARPKTHDRTKIKIQRGQRTRSENEQKEREFDQEETEAPPKSKLFLHGRERNRAGEESGHNLGLVLRCETRPAWTNRSQICCFFASSRRQKEATYKRMRYVAVSYWWKFSITGRKIIIAQRWEAWGPRNICRFATILRLG